MLAWKASHIYNNKNDTKISFNLQGFAQVHCVQEMIDIGEREDRRKGIDFLFLKSVYGEPLRGSAKVIMRANH